LSGRKPACTWTWPAWPGPPPGEEDGASRSPVELPVCCSPSLSGASRRGWLLEPCKASSATLAGTITATRYSHHLPRASSARHTSGQAHIKCQAHIRPGTHQARHTSGQAHIRPGAHQARQRHKGTRLFTRPFTPRAQSCSHSPALRTIHPLCHSKEHKRIRCPGPGPRPPSDAPQEPAELGAVELVRGSSPGGRREQRTGTYDGSGRQVHVPAAPARARAHHAERAWGWDAALQAYGGRGKVCKAAGHQGEREREREREFV